MAKTLHCSSPLLSQFYTLDEPAPAAGSIGSGFSTSTTAARAATGTSADLDTGLMVAHSVFNSITKPNTLTAGGNAARTSEPLVGNMLPGTFEFSIAGVRGGSNSTNPIQWNIQLYKSTSPTGANPIAIMPSIVQTPASNMNAFVIPLKASWTSTAKIPFNNEYLFFAFACRIADVLSLAARNLVVYQGATYTYVTVPDIESFSYEFVGQIGI